MRGDGKECRGTRVRGGGRVPAEAPEVQWGWSTVPMGITSQCFTFLTVQGSFRDVLSEGKKMSYVTSYSQATSCLGAGF